VQATDGEELAVSWHQHFPPARVYGGLESGQDEYQTKVYYNSPLAIVSDLIRQQQSLSPPSSLVTEAAKAWPLSLPLLPEWICYFIL